MRMTSQRKVILEFLKSTKNHPTAHDVYAGVKERLPGISPATVYRTLAWLTERGEALELTYGHQSSRYDGDTSDHSHLTCSRCGSVLDVSLTAPDIDLASVAAEVGAEVHGSRLELTGLCNDCQQQGGRE